VLCMASESRATELLTALKYISDTIMARLSRTTQSSTPFPLFSINLSHEFYPYIKKSPFFLLSVFMPPVEEREK